MTYLASAGASIAAIACLANQKTARTGNALGMMGVTSGIAATAGLLAPSAAVAGQLIGTLGLGLGAGGLIAQRMKMTELPQMVAAFHSLVRTRTAATLPLKYRAAERPVAHFHPCAMRSSVGHAAASLDGILHISGSEQLQAMVARRWASRP